MGQTVSIKQQQQDMDDFFETRSYDSHEDWRKDPRTAEDPDDAHDKNSRGPRVKPSVSFNIEPPVLRRG